MKPAVKSGMQCSVLVGDYFHLEGAHLQSESHYGSWKADTD